MEHQILHLINQQWTGPGLDLFMAALSSFPLWRIPMILTIVSVALLGRFRARALLLVIGLSIGIGNGMIIGPVKKATGRPRPHEMLANIRRVDIQNIKPVALALFQEAKVSLSHPKPGPVTGRSFPSAHAFNNFCIAMALTLFYRRFGWLYFIPAFLVAYSRMYVGAHWPTDVLAGALMGIGITLLLAVLLDMLWRAQGQKIAPSLYTAHPRLFGGSPACAKR